LGEIWVNLGNFKRNLIRYGKNQNLVFASLKIRSPTTMPKCLSFLFSIGGTTGMIMSVENNMLHFLVKQFQWSLSHDLSIFPSPR